MANRGTQSATELVAELNDLLQLDHDAVQAYNLAIENLETPSFRETLERFRGDHERHIRELTRLIREHDGMPIELSHVPTGFFKLAVQKVATAGSDREILLAFKANERQVRDKYRRHADAPHAQTVADVLRRNAADEDRHYGWVVEALSELGAGPESVAGKVEGAFETVHGRTADAVERGERKVMERAERMRRGVRDAGERVRTSAAGRLGQASRRVDETARRMDQRGGAAARAGSAGHRVADGLGSAADYVRSHDVTEMRDDAKQDIERHPLRWMLLSLGVGFVAGRMMR